MNESPSNNQLTELFEVIEQRRREMPEGSATTEAFQKGIRWMLLKFLEEAGEVSTAVVKEQGKEQLTLEASHLLYRLLLVLSDQRVSIQDVLAKLID